MDIFARLGVGFMGMEMTFFFLLNASYMDNISFLLLYQRQERAKYGRGRRKTDYMACGHGFCIMRVFRVERARRLYVS